MKTSDFDFALPPELIAHHPPTARDGARMMVVDRSAGAISHAMFSDFPTYLKQGDLVVLNSSRVVPARFFPKDGGKEILRTGMNPDGSWICLVRPGKHYKTGREVRIGDSKGEVIGIEADGSRIIHWHTEAPDPERDGELALPPYFDRHEEPDDRIRYQTVFAAENGSIAAPTAGLHFTQPMLECIPHTFLTLHVGVGTFRPVKSEIVEEHTMHSEDFSLSPASAAAINQAERVLAVGTTVTRTLEHCARLDDMGPLKPRRGSTDIFLKPGDPFLKVGALLTNFHLPKSTLLMLVSAFAGRELILEAYRQAVAEKYRFFSYGDCMLIL